MVAYDTLVYYFQSYGVLDFLLPFILVFTLIFAVSGVMPLFKEHRNFRAVIAFAIALTFVAPHVLGTYPGGYDPVEILNETLPGIALVAVGCVMLLILLGVFGKGFGDVASPFIAIFAIAFVAYIFGSAFDLWRGPYDVFSWWTPEVTELLIVILVFAVIVWLIVRNPENTNRGQGVQKVWEGLKGVLSDLGSRGGGGGGQH